MLKTPSNNIIPSPSYDFFKIAVGLKLLYAKNFSLQCWKLILCTFLRSWENHPSKSPETWFVGSLDGFLLKWRRVFLIFAYFTGQKRPQNGGHIGFLRFFGPWNEQKSLRHFCRNPPKEPANQFQDFYLGGSLKNVHKSNFQHIWSFSYTVISNYSKLQFSKNNY